VSGLGVELPLLLPVICKGEEDGGGGDYTEKKPKNTQTPFLACGKN
jgi:hypothetical protein